jgi:hypothetical protein
MKPYETNKANNRDSAHSLRFSLDPLSSSPVNVERGNGIFENCFRYSRAVTTVTELVIGIKTERQSLETIAQPLSAESEVAG